MRICILVGSTDISGGTYVIFEHALYLQSTGATVVLVPSDSLPHSESAWHPALTQLTFMSFAEAERNRFDLAIATWWRTVYELHRIEASQYCYFIQSIESWFYPEHEVGIRNLANATYTLGLPTVTEARWIQAHLKDHFDIDAHLAPNGCGKDVYQPEGPVVSPRTKGRLRVLVEGSLDVDFKNIARTIELLSQSEADEVWLLTISPVQSYPGASKVFSRVPAYSCGPIYRSCDVLVKLSYIEGMFGPPLEMFHCGGTAVVYAVTGHDEYIKDGVNALVIPTDAEDRVIAAVNTLKKDPAFLDRLKTNAVRTAADWPSWHEASSGFSRSLQVIVQQEPRYSRDRLRLLTDEFMKQYGRTEKILEDLRHRGQRSHLIKFLADKAETLSQHSKLAKRLISAIRAWRARRRKPWRRPPI